VIVARVVWRDGSRVGLSSDERLPVDDILSLGASSALTLSAPHQTSADAVTSERRREDRRSQGRIMEFVGVVAIACSLAVTAFDAVGHTLARPMAMVSQALGN
ncbi:MAG TPA: hypothetical protein VM145_06110, partial [Sphingomicrobium sp.]|nr:hypothetical protein [Sphingomicrobium sp.]